MSRGRFVRCSREGCENEGVSKCSGCKGVYYCCRECQCIDWKAGHKKICKKNHKLLPALDVSRYGDVPPQSRISAFWKWFEEADEELRTMNENGEAIAAGHRIWEQLQLVKEDLSWEMGSQRSSGRWKLVISADRFRHLSNAVIALIRARPEHLNKNWKFYAFRGREGLGERVSEEGTFDYKKIKYHLSKYGDDKVSIMLFMEGYDGQRHWFFQFKGEEYLEMAIGEFVFLNHVRNVWVCGMMEAGVVSVDGRIEAVLPLELERLKEDFDAFLSQKIGPRPEKGWAVLADLGDLHIRS